MNIPVETKPALWGALLGAIVVTIAGFTWLGWSTRSAAEAMARTRASDAVIVALAPVCVERFQHASGAAQALTELKKVETWSQGEFIEKGGWATVAGAPATDQVLAVARACASLLVPV
jgi:hypothetical protein